MSYEYNEITLERDIFKRLNFLMKRTKKIETKDTVKTSFYFSFFIILSLSTGWSLLKWTFISSNLLNIYFHFNWSTLYFLAAQKINLWNQELEVYGSKFSERPITESTESNRTESWFGSVRFDSVDFADSTESTEPTDSYRFYRFLPILTDFYRFLSVRYRFGIGSVSVRYR